MTIAPDHVLITTRWRKSPDDPQPRLVGASSTAHSTSNDGEVRTLPIQLHKDYLTTDLFGTPEVLHRDLCSIYLFVIDVPDFHGRTSVVGGCDGRSAHDADRCDGILQSVRDVDDRYRILPFSFDFAVVDRLFVEQPILTVEPYGAARNLRKAA